MGYQRSSFRVVHKNKKFESWREVNTEEKRIPKQEKKILGGGVARERNGERRGETERQVEMWRKKLICVWDSQNTIIPGGPLKVPSQTTTLNKT